MIHSNGSACNRVENNCINSFLIYQRSRIGISFAGNGDIVYCHVINNLRKLELITSKLGEDIFAII